MKNSGKCPKCSSSDLVTNSNRTKQGYRTIISISAWYTVQVATYICMQCGYIEEYVAEDSMKKPSKMDQLRARWKKP